MKKYIHNTRIGIILLVTALLFQVKAQAFYTMPGDTTHPVWPGDANGDGITDAQDVLYIGLAWGTKGPARSIVSDTWKADTCLKWTKFFKNGVNYNNADCNGDSSITLLDTVAIYNNYGLTHAGGKPLDTAYLLHTPDLTMSVSPETLKKGDSIIHITVVTGSRHHLIDSIYGISFELAIDSNYINKYKKSTITFNDLWLGSYSIIKIPFFKDELRTKGFFAMAYTRNDHVNSHGYDTLCSIDVVIVDNLSGGVAKINPRLRNINALTAYEHRLKFNVHDSVTVTKYTATHDIPLQKKLRVERLPGGQVRLVSDHIITSMEVIDMMGQTVQVSSPHQSNVTFSPKGLPAGVYAVVLTFEDGSRVTKPMVINTK